MRILLALSAVVIAGCLTGPEDGSIDGTYMYVGRTAEGTVGTKGTITLQTVSDTTFTGTWTLAEIQGDGVLEGWRRNEEIFMDLHPGWRDHNLILMGKLKDGVITGRWQWIGFAGVVSEGAFEATKVR